ncbi:MAG: photosynthetic reaction center subunit L [Chloroflexi bacterium]|jgi:photosynthetic reaction center L subunit|nr:MAG: photosynthetic reaction center subunit L [Chloroflexota bacterium]
MSRAKAKDPRFPDFSFTVVEGARATRVPGGRTIEEIEPEYKIKGRTTFSAIFRYDPFDFWVGPFYVGFWGFVSVIGIIFGAYFYINETILKGPYSFPQNFFAGRIDPPPAELGLGFAAPGEPGFAWQMTVLFATIAFFGWMMRQVDISMKLDMGYHVPIAFGVAVSAWTVLQIIRPIALGMWHEGFVLGVMPHLDWVSNFGYRYNNFFYNPFHAIGITGLFASTWLLACHGSLILSAAQYRGPEGGDIENVFFRDVQYYSVGEAGVHRLGYIFAIGGILSADLCILLSGWPVQDWVSFWNFWNNLPFWSGV